MPPFDHFAAIAPLYARVTYSKVDVMCEVAELPAQGRLLDVGGGTGRVSSAIRDLVDEVIIADVSFGMLKEAHRTVTSTPLSASLKPVCGGSESLPFADNFFERVIMVDAFHHVIRSGRKRQRNVPRAEAWRYIGDRRTRYPHLWCEVDRNCREVTVNAKSLPFPASDRRTVHSRKNPPSHKRLNCLGDYQKMSRKLANAIFIWGY